MASCFLQTCRSKIDCNSADRKGISTAFGRSANTFTRFLDRCMSVYRINSNVGSWSSGVDFATDKLITFITGVVEMLRTFRPHVGDEKLLRLATLFNVSTDYLLGVKINIPNDPHC